MHAKNMQRWLWGRIGFCISPRSSRSKAVLNDYRHTGLDFELLAPIQTIKILYVIKLHLIYDNVPSSSTVTTTPLPVMLRAHTGITCRSNLGESLLRWASNWSEQKYYVCSIASSWIWSVCSRVTTPPMTKTYWDDRSHVINFSLI